MFKPKFYLRPPLPSIPERTELPLPPSPNNSHKSTSSTTIDQPLPRSTSLPNPTPATTPASPPPTFPQRILVILRAPLWKSSATTAISSASTSHHAPPHYAPQRPNRSSRRQRLQTRPLFPSTYHSFPPPTFTTDGQPRALDSRLDASPLHSPASSVASLEATHPSSSNPHLASPKPQLLLRGGASPSDRLPAGTWWLAGGRGRPPKTESYRAWRDRERQRIRGENERRGRRREGRGFWREVRWALWGGKMGRGTVREEKEGKGKEGENRGEGAGGAGSEGGGEEVGAAAEGRAEGGAATGAGGAGETGAEGAGDGAGGAEAAGAG